MLTQKELDYIISCHLNRRIYTDFGKLKPL